MLVQHIGQTIGIPLFHKETSGFTPNLLFETKTRSFMVYELMKDHRNVYTGETGDIYSLNFKNLNPSTINVFSTRIFFIVNC